ncbi:hypothetical protein HOY82DRAFT_572200 [Tuber indicum]|nr:hypothetical protein HOY82DRAFT_572200 [Tuber indicum]
MPCYNCTSRVLRIFLQGSIAASIPWLRPRLQHYYFRQQQQRFSPCTRVPFHISQRLQSTLASGSAPPLPSDDDYIPFGPPITTMNELVLASDDGRLSGLLPPPPPVPLSTPLQASHGYEPEVEILKLPELEPESQAREAESKRTIEFIRRKIEASWAQRSSLHSSMVETGLPVVGWGADLLEDARSAVLQKRAARVVESGNGEGVGEGSHEVKGRGDRKLPTMKKEANRPARREAKRRVGEIMRPKETRKKLKKVERKEMGRWGALKVARGHPMEHRLVPGGGQFPEAKEGKDEALEVKEREDRGEVKVQRTVFIGHNQIPVPVVKQSLPKSTKAIVPSIQQFIRDERDPFDRKAFSRERAKTRKSAGKKEEVKQRQQSTLYTQVREDSEREPKRRKKNWELPPIEEVKKEPNTDKWGARQKLQHYVATTPRSELEDWKVQKAALQKKFGKGWAPRKKLSLKARDWVKELHSSVPELTTEKLAEIFRISPEAIRRILKTNWTPSPKEARDRNQRWQRRRESIWERWIDIGHVQTKGMKAEVQKLKQENREKWHKKNDEALKQYSEKNMKAWKERSAALNSLRGRIWKPSDEKLFQDEPEFSDAGDMMANEKYARDLRKKMKKRSKQAREYREGLEKAKSFEASTTPERFPAESLAKLSSRFL